MSRKNLRSALAELEAEARAGAHPDAGELIDYQEEKLAPEAAARVAEHLIFCASCAATLFDLEAGPATQLADPRLARSAAEVEEDWQAILSRLPAEAAAPAPAAQPAPAPAAVPPPAPLPFRAPPAAPLFEQWGSRQLAAIFGLLAIGLGIFAFSLLRSLDAPRANAFVADLAPQVPGESRERSRGSGAAVTEVPAGTQLVVFLLAQKEMTTFTDYSAELVGPQGDLRWQAEGLRMAKEGGFSLAIPVASLPAGELEIRLYGGAGRERRELATYSTRVVFANP